MPIYSFECTYGHVVDEIFSKSVPEGHIIKCPHCGAEAKRLPVYTAYMYVPSIHQETYWTDKKRAIQRRNNSKIAQAIKEGKEIELDTRNVPREFIADLDRQIKEK